MFKLPYTVQLEPNAPAIEILPKAWGYDPSVDVTSKTFVGTKKRRGKIRT